MKHKSRRKAAALWAFAAVAVISIRLARTELQGPDGEVLAITTQSDGKAIVGGRFSDARIQRRNTDGTIDSSFSRSWSIGGFNAPVLTLATQADDRILVGGEFTNFDASLVGYIARLNRDGSLDTGFARAIGTGFDGPVRTLTALRDGKILAAGEFLSFNGTRVGRVARLNADGSLDSSFDSGSGFDGTVNGVAALPSDQYIFVGSFTSYRDLTHRSLAAVASGGDPVTKDSDAASR